MQEFIPLFMISENKKENVWNFFDFRLRRRARPNAFAWSFATRRSIRVARSAPTIMRPLVATARSIKRVAFAIPVTPGVGAPIINIFTSSTMASADRCP